MTPRNEDSAAGNRLREIEQHFETLEPEVQFTGVCGKTTFIHKIAVGRYCRTVLHVDDEFGDGTPVCREFTCSRADSDSRLFVDIRERRIIGPVLLVPLSKFLGNYGMEIQIIHDFAYTHVRGNICRGQNRFVEEVPHLEPGPNPTSKDLLRDSVIAKGNESCATELNQSRIEETHATQELVPTGPVYNVKETIRTRERKWIDIPVNKFYKEYGFSAEISKSVMRLGRHFDQNEREDPLGFDRIKTTKCVPEAWKLRILRLGLGKIRLLEKQQDQVPMLQEFQTWKFLIVYSCHSWTHWWVSDSVWIVGSRRCSIQLERVDIPQRLF